MSKDTLSKHSMEKLESMPREVQIKLFNRLRIIELNKKIGPILTNAVGSDYLRKIKAKIIHQLYDKNCKKDAKYKDLQSLLESGENFYDHLDVYTTEAYANYYATFVRYASKACTFNGVEDAMMKAYQEVHRKIQTEALRIDCLSKKTAIPSALLQAKYRKTIIAYLEKELDTKFNIGTITHIIRQTPQEEYESPIDYDEEYYARRSRSSRNLERYESTTGEEYYLDADGEFYSPDQIYIESDV